MARVAFAAIGKVLVVSVWVAPVESRSVNWMVMLPLPVFSRTWEIKGVTAML